MKAERTVLPQTPRVVKVRDTEYRVLNGRLEYRRFSANWHPWYNPLETEDLRALLNQPYEKAEEQITVMMSREEAEAIDCRRTYVEHNAAHESFRQAVGKALG